MGDTGTGGTAGLAPAPAAGAAAAGKYLKADGTWQIPPTGSSSGNAVYSGFGSPNGSDVDLAPHNMTGDGAPSPYVASSDQEEWGTHAFNVFDGSDGTGLAPYGLPFYAQIDLGSIGPTLTKYAVKGNGNRAPNAWTLNGSDDGTTWTELDTRTGQASWGNPEMRTFTLTGVTTGYRYYRLTTTAYNGDGNGPSVNELYLYKTSGLRAGNDGDLYTDLAPGHTQYVHTSRSPAWVPVGS